MINTVAFIILLFGQVSAPALPIDDLALPDAPELTADVPADIPATDIPEVATPEVVAPELDTSADPILTQPVDSDKTEALLPDANVLPADAPTDTEAKKADNSDALSTPLLPVTETKESTPAPKPHENERMIPPPVLPKPKTDAVNNSDPMLDPNLGIVTSPQTEDTLSSLPKSNPNTNSLSATTDSALQPINSIPSYSSVEDEEMFGVQLAPNQARGHIMPIEQAEVPAQEQGVLLKFHIREGAIVNKNAPLAQIDDEQAQMAVQVQQAKLNAAQKEATNEVNVKYAKAARDVAEAEVQSAEETIARVPGAVPASEIRKLKLSLVQATYQIEQAKNNLEIAGYQVEVSRAELNAAKLGITKRVVRAPISGVVVEKYRYEGEWVKPGDPIVKIVYLDKLRVKTTMDINAMPPQKVMNHSAKVTITQPGAPEFKGKVIFASPIVQSGGSYEVWVDVDNAIGQGGFWILQPGMNATVTIE